MRLHFSDPNEAIILNTDDDREGIRATLGLFIGDQGNREYLSLTLPPDRTYLARHMTDWTFHIVVIPEGLTPGYFGWKDWRLIKLSSLIQDLEDNTGEEHENR